jgi:hypothetical protein
MDKYIAQIIHAQHIFHRQIFFFPLLVAVDIAYFPLNLYGEKSRPTENSWSKYNLVIYLSIRAGWVYR